MSILERADTCTCPVDELFWCVVRHNHDTGEQLAILVYDKETDATSKAVVYNATRRRNRRMNCSYYAAPYQIGASAS